ncbi:MAG TPA: hypothetical protein VGL63_00905 [Streptosporangiaceae bacterium]|jgi:hypothetical protein
MRTHSEYSSRPRGQRLADLKSKAAELERRLTDARASLEQELEQSVRSRATMADRMAAGYPADPDDIVTGGDPDVMADLYSATEALDGYGRVNSGGRAHIAEDRTETLVSHGRASAYSRARSRRLSPGRKAAIGAATVAMLVTVLVLLTDSGPSWPASVATVKSESVRACQNPDVRSEPGQVNFACAPATRQILWVLALMTSGDNPYFANGKTGREGLEPITPAQGGEIAWSLNLHQPYNPTDPIDSLEVAARAINNIIGGATLTGPNGTPVVQAGLEGHPANCLRYTGSAAMSSRAGFPSVCAKPVTSQAGQAALVSDVYQKWVVGSAPQAAQDAAVLFQNADNPGDARVQAILKRLADSAPLDATPPA